MNVPVALERIMQGVILLLIAYMLFHLGGYFLVRLYYYQ